MHTTGLCDSKSSLLMPGSNLYDISFLLTAFQYAVYIRRTCFLVSPSWYAILSISLLLIIDLLYVKQKKHLELAVIRIYPWDKSLVDLAVNDEPLPFKFREYHLEMRITELALLLYQHPCLC